jgi:hypothetical protein
MKYKRKKENKFVESNRMPLVKQLFRFPISFQKCLLLPDKRLVEKSPLDQLFISPFSNSSLLHELLSLLSLLLIPLLSPLPYPLLSHPLLSPRDIPDLKPLYSPLLLLIKLVESTSSPTYESKLLFTESILIFSDAIVAIKAKIL